LRSLRHACSIEGVTPEETFALLVTDIGREPGVSGPDESGSRRFGSAALKVRGSIFAMLQAGHLVVKLPSARVAALIESEDGQPFGAGKGRPMKEWVLVPSDDVEAWGALAREALAFVRAGRR
jgi:hypothetical protein